MKMVKSLLLGSAAGVVAVVGAQAADLPVKAKPVEYVKICTLYGDGFYYIPGTDTCVRFSGYVRADYGYNVNGGRTVNYAGAFGAQDRTVNNYTTRHRGSFSVDARTQTAYGTLRTFTTMHLQNEDGTESTNIARAFIQWGGFTFGRTVSFFDTEGTLGDSGLRSLHQSQQDNSTGANGINQIAYTWQLGNGFTLNVGADERRIRNIANMSVVDWAAGVNPATSRAGDNHPNPYVSLRVNQAWGRAMIGVGAAHNQATYYTVDGTAGCAFDPGSTLCGYPNDKWGWAVVSGAEIKLGFLSPGSRVGGFVNYGVGATRLVANNIVSPSLFGSGNTVAIGAVTDAVYLNGGGLERTTAFSAGGGFEYFWTRNFSSTIYGAFTEISYSNNVVNGAWFCVGNANIVQVSGGTCDPGFKMWTIGSHHDWFPVPGLRFAVDVMYTNIESNMSGQTVLLTATQGARPSGVYQVKDTGIVSAIFRAQRTWGAGD